MLKITIPKQEVFDQESQSFSETKEISIQLEHSLISLSKWEAKWHKPFLSEEVRTYEETLDYIRCMTITQNVDDNVYKHIPDNVINQVNDYINDKMTATWFNEINQGPGKAKKKEIITSEIIYYWMISLQIPMECQKWHLNRLITLVKVINIKNYEAEEQSKRGKNGNPKAALNNYRNINAARRAALGTKG